MKFEGPEPEYLDGELWERHLGGIPHSGRQGNLLAVFRDFGRHTPLRAFPELHLGISPGRYRIADIAVFIDEPVQDIPTEPPLITIEIISPDDSLTQIRSKSKEYLSWEVKHVWLVDPQSRTLSVYDNGIIDVAEFRLPEFGLVITPEQVFD